MLFGISPEDALGPVSTRVAELRQRSDVVVVLGGDNSVTRPGVHGMGELGSMGLITFDAHFDLRELEDGLTNGNPIRALLRDGLPGPHIAQIGILPFANSPRHAEVAREAGINVVSSSLVMLVYPHTADPGVVDPLRLAAEEGGASFFTSGIDPGFANDLIVGNTSQKVDQIVGGDPAFWSRKIAD